MRCPGLRLLRVGVGRRTFGGEVGGGCGSNNRCCCYSSRKLLVEFIVTCIHCMETGWSLKSIIHHDCLVTIIPPKQSAVLQSKRVEFCHYVVCAVFSGSLDIQLGQWMDYLHNKF